MSDMEERPSLIVECPHCHVKVIPKANNICPACQNDISNLQGVDFNKVSVSVYESKELPTFCYSCNRFSERSIRVSGDKESDSEKAIFGSPSPEKTTNVIIYLPQCDDCAEWDEPEIISVDYEHQSLKVMVHKGFRDRVTQLRDL